MLITTCFIHIYYENALELVKFEIANSEHLKFKSKDHFINNNSGFTCTWNYWTLAISLVLSEWFLQ